MKTLYMTMMAVLMFAFTGIASADNDCKEEWKEKMLNEKIAFLSVEIGLNSEDAQKFWPVYNEINKEKDEALHDVFKAFRAMEDAVKAGKSEKEISRLLENYRKALDAQREVESKAMEKFSKVLSPQQLAKLYIGEEKLRRQHIRRLRPDSGQKPEQRPQPRR